MTRCGRGWENPALPHDVGQIASLTPFHHQTLHHLSHHLPSLPPLQWHQSAATSV
jgi:hypothetical protein